MLPNPSRDVPVAPPPAQGLLVVLTFASWLCNILTFLLVCVWVGGSRLAPGLDLSSIIPDALIRVAFFAGFGSAALAASLGWLALRYGRGSYAITPWVGRANASFVTGLVTAILYAAFSCNFLLFAAACGRHC